jgi:hypothetical protein
MFYWNGECTGKFESAPTRRYFVDYVLEDEYGADCGEWGKVRVLTEVEKQKYKCVFKKLNPSIDMDKVRLVEFCWYNCCEAPDYYSLCEDPFYSEIPFICNFTLD